jgi:hypothetical protein
LGEKMNNPTGRQAQDDEMIATLGGGILTGSGFENEPPDSDFAEAEANESDGQ